jgi:hypothetical protein
MSDPSKVQEIVEQIVSEVFQNRLAELRTEVAKRVVEQLGTPEAGEASGNNSGNATALLNSAVLSVQNSTTQTGILSALLEGAAGFSGRVALFVLRGNQAIGWQGRGFADDSFIKRLNFDPTTGLAGRAMQDRMPVSAAATEFSPEMVREAGNPADGNGIVLPLVVREKVPALLYADRGPQLSGQLDSSALELLVRSAGVWLEVVSARRAGAGGAAERIPDAPPERVVEKPVEAAPPPAPPVVAREPVVEAVRTPAAAPAPEPPPPPPQAAPAPAAAPVAATPQDEEVHKKAKRFAKLLVDEIRLYNQAKVAEGRQKHDLYDRLKEDIEKSRMTYDKRYGKTAAASANYFNLELIRVLADSDVTLLGGNFSQS